MIKPSVPRFNRYHPLARGLRGAWLMNEGYGNKAYDLSGRDNHATFNSGASWISEGGGRVIDCTEPGDMSIPTITVADATAWTVAFSCRQDIDGNDGMVLGDDTSTTQFIWLFPDTVRTRVGGLSSNKSWTGVTFATRGKMTDYVMTCDAARNLKLYIDGVKHATDNTATNSALVVNNIGAGYSTNLGFDGVIRYVNIWEGRAFSQADVDRFQRDPFAMFRPRNIAYFLPQPSETVTVTSPVAYQTFQRTGTTASIPISGTYSGTPTAIEASFNGGAYATIDASPSGGTFSGTLASQSQGQGTLTVRYTNDTGVTDTVADVGIGDVYLVLGDSIAEGRGTNAQSHGWTTKATNYRQDNLWKEGNDPMDTNTTIGSHWPLLAKHIMQSEGVPVAMMVNGTGSQDITGTLNGWAVGNGSYNTAKSEFAAFGQTVKACLVHLGPNAVADASGTVSQATYNAALDSWVTGLQTDFQSGLQIVIGMFGEVSTGSPPDRTAALNNVRLAIREAWGDNSDVLFGPVLIDADYTDGVHPKSDAQLQQVADRFWLALEEHFYGGTDGRGPVLSQASENAARNAITIQFDQAIAQGQTYTVSAFEVHDDGTPVTIEAVTEAGTDSVVLTLAAALTGSVTTVYLGNGDDCVGATIPKSTNKTLPDTSTINLPAEVIIAQTVTQFGSGSGGVSKARIFGGL